MMKEVDISLYFIKDITALSMLGDVEASSSSCIFHSELHGHWQTVNGNMKAGRLTLASGMFIQHVKFAVLFRFMY